MGLLGQEAKEDARKLLTRSGQHPNVICSCLDLLGAEAKEKANELLNEERQHPNVICRCLELLGEEAKEDARKLLTRSGQNREVICSCLAFLGPEVKEKAHELLNEERQHPNVICRCLELLGEEAKEDARKLLKEPGQYPDVLCRCITIASDTPEAQKVVESILLRWQAGEKLNFAYKNAALRVPFDTKLQKKMALQVLKQWHRELRPLVASALTIFSNYPDEVRDFCQEILKRWYQDIDYQLRNKRKSLQGSDAHIVKALAHPKLRKQARMAAKQMLEKEADLPGFLTPLLHEQVLKITDGQFLSWTGKEEET